MNGVIRPAAVSDIEPFQIRGKHAVRGVALSVNPLDSSALDEVVHIGTAEPSRNGGVDRVNGDSQCACLFPIHVDSILGHILQPAGADTDQPRVLGGHAEQLVAGIHQGFVSQSAPVLQLEVEPACPSKLDDCRRWERKHPGVADRCELPHGAPHHGVHFQVCTAALVPVPEHDEGQSHVLSASGKASAGKGKAGIHRFLFIHQKMASDLVHDLRGLLQRGTRGQRHLGVHHPLVLIGEIGGGHSSEEEHHGDHQHQVDAQVGELPGKDMAD